MSSVPTADIEVEEGSPIGGDSCEDGSPINQESLENEETDQNEENIFPFANLAVEFYEEPEEGEDSSTQKISEHLDIEDTRNITDSQEIPITACDNSQDSSVSMDEVYSDNSKSNVAESEKQDGEELTLDMDVSESYEPNVLEKDDALNVADYEEMQKTCIQNFTYSACSSFDEASNPASDESKGSPLSRFPKIVKALESADYEILQILYQLLYQRSAWDTQEILKHRIMEFSGFTFSQNTEDYFNSEMMLRTLPDNVLIKIGGILCSDLMRHIPANISKCRSDLISNILEFLCKPRKRTRVPKLGQDTDNVTPPNSVSKCGCRSRCLKKFTLKEQERLLNYMEIIKERKLLDSYILNLLAIRKITRKSTTEETKKIREISYQYKVKSGNKEALVCKGAFCILHGIKMGKVSQIQNKLKSGRNLPPEIKSEDFPKFENVLPEEDVSAEGETPNASESEEKSQTSPRKSPSSQSPRQKELTEEKQQNSKLGENLVDHFSMKKVPKVVVEKIDLNSLNVGKDLKIAEAYFATEKKNSMANEKKPDSPTKSKAALPESKNTSPAEKKPESPPKLRDFPLVVKSIENASEELLIDVHFLLFLTSSDVDKIKDKILDFSGFTFDSDTEEYDERNEFLQRMSNKIVTDVARAFSLAILSTKEDTIKNILSFLSKPDENYLRTYGSVPVILSDVELDDIDMSDSDESITCEVVEKKVECIDLISSGEESDKEEKAKKAKPKIPVPSQAPNVLQKPVIEQQKATPDPPLPAVNNSATLADSSTSSQPSEKRTLRNFETICKIVNTHPHEYLVDIYDLLYMKKHDPNTLRSDILDFSGFTFERGSAEYIKRKQLLDRMLYNSVRRIYNTLIHNTTEIKVFSKPTMITEIFQFLFKLPDHDTSIRPTATTRPLTKPLGNKSTPAKNTTGVSAPSSSGPPLPNQTGKLSDLKRVFQRVACFPCEYLIDVHKLLFMTDCDPKVIRQNIFGFKGFSFGVESPEFQQRKMYLEYLTFHSLRKISSVLTTRSVDLRNSTKHELATHLTQVLAEYTNTCVETEPLGASESNNCQTDQNNVAATTAPSDPNVENIVVTPIIDTMQTSPSSTSVENQGIVTSVSSASETVMSTQSEVSSTSTIKSSVPDKKTENPPALAISIVETRSISQSPVSSVSGSKNQRKRKNVAKTGPDKKAGSQAESTQFADINLPEIEQYRQIYGQNLNLYAQNMPAITGITTFSGSGVVPQSFPHLVPQTLSFPVVHTYSQPLQVQTPFQPMSQTSQVLGIQTTLAPAAVIAQVPAKPNEVIVPGECSLNDGSTEEPVTKKSKTSNSPGEKETISSKKVSISPEEALVLQSKLRHVMSSNDDDEEDCDKPLASLIGHPIDSVLKKQICDIVEQTDLQDITINGVIQKIYNMYPKFDLSYRKEFIKSTLRAILYKLGEKKNSEPTESREANSPDCSVSTTDIRDSPVPDSAETAVASS